MKSRTLSLLGASLLWMGCSPAVSKPHPLPPPPPPAAVPTPPAPPTASVGPLDNPPAPAPAAAYVPPHIEEARLPNGLRVLVITRHELPIVAAHLVLDRGADQGPPGLGSFAGAMLMSGTKMSALELSDAVERLGGHFGAFVDYDGAHVTAQVLTDKLPAALSLIADVVEHPAFDDKEIERERTKRLTAVLQERDSPGALLSNALGKALYGEKHAYGVSLLSDEAAIKRIDKKALVAFHALQFHPDHATIALAGDITREQAVAAVEKALGTWSGQAAAAPAPAEAPPIDPKAARIVLVDRPRASQSSVAVALPGVPRKSPDFDALTVMNTILGGQFSSRLNLNLREKHAYTYGAHSYFDFRRGPGPFRAGGEIVREATEPAVREIFAEIDRLRTELVPDDELTAAKTNLNEQLPARFETAAGAASSAAALAIYDLPLDEFATRPARIDHVTAEDVKRVAETYLRGDRVRLLVVGDAASVEPGLSKFGAERGFSLEVVAAPAPPAKAAGHAKKSDSGPAKKHHP